MKLNDINDYDKLLIYCKNKQTNLNYEEYKETNVYEVIGVIKSYETPIGFVDKYSNIYIVDNSNKKLFSNTTSKQLGYLLKNFTGITIFEFVSVLSLLQQIRISVDKEFNIGYWSNKDNGTVRII